MFPTFEPEPPAGDDAERIAARTGLPVDEVRRALARLREERFRNVIAARTLIAKKRAAARTEVRRRK